MNKRRPSFWMRATTIAGLFAMVHVLLADSRESPTAEAAETTVATPTEAASEAAYASPLTGRSADDTVSEYLEIIHEGRSSTETTAYLVEWLRANPEQTRALVDRVHDGAFEGEAHGLRGLFAALGRARTAQADDALMGLLMAPGGSLEHRVSAAKTLWALAPARSVSPSASFPRDSIAALTRFVGGTPTSEPGSLAFNQIASVP